MAKIYENYCRAPKASSFPRVDADFYSIEGVHVISTRGSSLSLVRFPWCSSWNEWCCWMHFSREEDCHGRRPALQTLGKSVPAGREALGGHWDPPRYHLITFHPQTHQIATKIHFHQNQNWKTVRQLNAENPFDGGGTLRQRFAFHPSCETWGKLLSLPKLVSPFIRWGKNLNADSES